MLVVVRAMKEVWWWGFGGWTVLCFGATGDDVFVAVVVVLLLVRLY